jgi:hypothetical protein
MPDDHHPLAERGRSLEEEYFRARDRELVEKMRRAAAAEQTREQLRTRTGLQDPELVKELEALGFTPDTVDLLPFVPLVQVAWAEGDVSDAERKLVTRLARSRGIAEGSASDRQLTAWLANRPAADVFARAMRLVRAVLASPAQQAAMTADDLVKYCESIADASGGIFGLKRISAEERAVLNALAADLKAR